MAKEFIVEDFTADKDENKGQRIFHIFESLEDRGDREIHRAKTQNRENIAGIDHERLCRDRKNRRHAIQREQYVHKFDTDQRHEKRGREQDRLARDQMRAFRKEIMAVDFVGITQMLFEEPDQGRVLKLVIIVLHKQHLDPGQDQEARENEQDPVERLDQNAAQTDHHPAHDEDAHNPPEEDAVLEFFWNGEIGQDDRHHEKIVEGKRQLDKIGGKIIDAVIAAEGIPQPGTEQDGKPHIEGRKAQALLRADNFVLTVQNEQVEKQEDDNNPDKTAPDFIAMAQECGG